jgi:hypothetical protein
LGFDENLRGEKNRDRSGSTEARRSQFCGWGGVYMGYDGIKLVYFDGKPQWLMPDGSFVPVKRRSGETFSPGSIYLKDKKLGESRLIVD